MGGSGYCGGVEDDWYRAAYVEGLLGGGSVSRSSRDEYRLRVHEGIRVGREGAEGLEIVAEGSVVGATEQSPCVPRVSTSLLRSVRVADVGVSSIQFLHNVSR